ncbi:hypothetical protein EW145_g5322 [Phellinidium pouzarii]|uniref:Uncharacterized protein n=1 Tax=Phellinidium pouzarii TaxID=167371 RepID=A0A4S4L0D4_9AGAM|nr:hypothetical protein EW145_g5322 [Phellinidium pouzarii]
MDHLPPKPLTDAPAVWPQPRSTNDRSAVRSMAHPRDCDRDREREPRDRDRDRDRERDRLPYDGVWAAGAGPARRDDVDWARDEREERERRDERHYRGGGYSERGGWPDDRARDRIEGERVRERYRDWEREPRVPYVRPRERGWERDERGRGMDVRYGGDNYRSAHPRRQEMDHRHQSSPHPARSPAYRGRDDRRASGIRADDIPPPSGRRQRDGSVDSRRSSIRRGGDERIGPVPYKRERSSSPPRVSAQAV